MVDTVDVQRRPKRQELAAALGISRQMVHKLEQQGMSTKSVDAAMAWRAANLNPAKRKTDAQADSEDAPTTPKEITFSEARARREHLAAEQAELNLGVARRKLVDADETQRAIFTAFRRLRDHVMRVPRSASVLVVGLRDVREVELILESEIRARFDSFAVDMQTALDQGGAKG